jgi:hypothetical protein
MLLLFLKSALMFAFSTIFLSSTYSKNFRHRHSQLRYFSTNDAISPFHFLKRNEDEALEACLPELKKPFRIDFLSKEAVKRRKEAHQELIIKAFRNVDLILDFTAGLGRDASILAATGKQVLMFEKNEAIYLLLQDALQRLQQAETQGMSTEKLSSKLTLIHQDACLDQGKLILHLLEAYVAEFLLISEKKLEWKVGIYLDPMYPEPPNLRTAKSKKDTQILQLLTTNVSENNQEEVNEEKRQVADQLLFETAGIVLTQIQNILSENHLTASDNSPFIRLKANRIVVKRNRHDPPLISTSSSDDMFNKFPYLQSTKSTVVGSTQRFDIYHYTNSTATFGSITKTTSSSSSSST